MRLSSGWTWRDNMTINRAQVEQILVRRCGAYMAAAGLDSELYDGTNKDLNDPIGYAVRMCDGTVSDYTTIANADLLTVASTDYDKLLDIAELRLLDSIASNLDDVDLVVGQRSEKLNQLALNLQAIMERKANRVEKSYGIGAPIVGTGAIVLDFADHNEALPT